MIKVREQLIPLNAVLYFTSDVRKIGAFFLNDEKAIWFYGKLDELEKQLKPFGYLRCHQSYLVNMHKIEGIQGREVITFGGTFPISRSYMESVKEQWKQIGEKLYNNANIESFAETAPDESISDEELVMENESTIVVTKKYTSMSSKYGVIVGISGELQNNSYRIYENEEILIGRDSRKSQLVIRNPSISRKHCGIKFSVAKQCYYIYDYNSTNGTSVSGMGKLSPNNWISAPRNTLLQLAKKQYIFYLA